MGITARGGWEAVKRHFRELGKDIQKEAFTVVGVGDMSGDVFGNGMLLSKKIRLVAAFDHRDIFIDPNPSPTKSYNERKRLFELPRSSWEDYDKSLISKGGGVFSRSAKSISLSPEMRKALATEAKAMAPNELIKTILKAPVELIWLGGVGAFFKSETEDHWRVGDRVNDAIRIDAAEIRAQVIGEGANLGLTQRARIEYALRGGRVNTDAIDNSAGVDSSDHEVNIKILLSAAIEQAELKSEDRNELLASMTEDVAGHVLRHNYDQTRALTLMEATASADIDIHARFIATLERRGRLNRTIESLPSEKEIAERRQQGRGLTRPELAVLLAYAKMLIFDELVASAAPDDPAFEAELFNYFPAALHKFTKPIVDHQLRREIIATRISNEIMDSCGVAFAQRVTETSRADFPTVALAYEAARRIYGLGEFAQAVDALDNIAPAPLQTELYLEASSLLKEEAFRLLTEKRSRDIILLQGVKNVVARYQAPVAELKKALGVVLSPDAAAALEARAEDWAAKGAPETLAHEAAMLSELENALDIVDLAIETGWSNPGVAAVYFALERMFNIDALSRSARNALPSDHFDKVALREIVDDIAARQRRLTRAVLNFADAEPAGAPGSWVSKLLARWEEHYKAEVHEFKLRAGEMDIVGSVSIGKLSLFVRFFDDLIHALET
jgi:glutamate dehydrogenase